MPLIALSAVMTTTLTIKITPRLRQTQARCYAGGLLYHHRISTACATNP